MATQQITIFDNNLVPNQENLSTQFDHGIGFYLIQAGADERRVEIFLQVQISNTEYRQIRLPDNNISSTQRMTLLPAAVVELALPMRLAIVPSDAFDLTIILVQSSCSLCSIQSNTEQIINEIEQAKSLDWQSIILDFAIDNFLPPLVQALLPGVETLLTELLADLVTPDGGNENETPTTVEPVGLPASTENFFIFI